MIAPWASPSSVSSVLVVPPAEEPLTLDEAKLRAGLDWPAGDPRDALMTDFIAAARQKVELDTGLALIKQTRDVSLTVVPGELVPLPMHALPLLSITDPAGVRVPTTGYRVDRARRALVWASPLAYDVSGTWQIEAGWLDAATLRKEAPLLVQAVGLLTAHYATLGRDLAAIDEAYAVPYGYDECVQPYRLVWLP